MKQHFELTIHASRRPELAHSTTLHMYRHEVGTRELEYAEIQWKKLADGAQLPSMLRVDEEDSQVLQTLCDDLYRAGFKPREAGGTAGEIAQAHRHIEDLRAIAFHALKMPSSAGRP